MAIVTLEQRRQILDNAVSQYVSRGFRVVSRTDTTAQLVKPKHPNMLLVVIFLILSLALFGLILLLLYLIFYWALAKDQQVYLTVDDAGRVHRQ